MWPISLLQNEQIVLPILPNAISIFHSTERWYGDGGHSNNRWSECLPLDLKQILIVGFTDATNNV